MNLNEYQNEVMRTAATDKDPTLQLAVLALGVAGEAGEVADLIKKHVGHSHELDRFKLAKELGDVLWYVAALAQAAGFTLDDVAKGNVMKLRARYPNGFTVEASKVKADEQPASHPPHDNEFVAMMDASEVEEGKAFKASENDLTNPPDQSIDPCKGGFCSAEVVVDGVEVVRCAQHGDCHYVLVTSTGQVRRP